MILSRQLYWWQISPNFYLLQSQSGTSDKIPSSGSTLETDKAWSFPICFSKHKSQVESTFNTEDSVHVYRRPWSMSSGKGIQVCPQNWKQHPCGNQGSAERQTICTKVVPEHKQLYSSWNWPKRPGRSCAWLWVCTSLSSAPPHGTGWQHHFFRFFSKLCIKKCYQHTLPRAMLTGRFYGDFV